MQNAHWIKPLSEKIVVKPFASDEFSEAGLIIPESVRKRPAKATVVAVGGGTEKRPMQFEPGDIVFHVKDCGDLIQYDDVDYYIMKDVDILAKLEN